MKTENAIKTIESGRFRISRILELNDPFECRPGLEGVPAGSEPLFEAALDAAIHDFHEKFGLICCSEAYNEPIMWSHYADSHAGIAIEVDQFKHVGNYPVTYTNERVTIDPGWFDVPAKRPECEQRLLASFTRKSAHWAYERERRAIFDLEKADVSGGSYFVVPV